MAAVVFAHHKDRVDTFYCINQLTIYIHIYSPLIFVWSKCYSPMNKLVPPYICVQVESHAKIPHVTGLE